jgi:methionyl-tRNA synthetase
MRKRRFTKEQFKEFINSNLGNELLLMLETTKSVTAHEYYDYYIQQHQELEEYEECARLLKLKNETPYSEELTHTITKSGRKFINKNI